MTQIKKILMEELYGLNSLDKQLVDTNLKEVQEEKLVKLTLFSLAISDSEPKNGPFKNSSRNVAPSQASELPWAKTEDQEVLLMLNFHQELRLKKA